jgi:hypothetical protein
MMTSLSDYQKTALLHLHIPKTAGMALNDAILDVYGHPELTEEEDGRLVGGVYYPAIGIDGDYVPDDAARRVLRRADLRAVVGHFSFGLHEHVARPSAYVAVLRHPVDRVLSLYHHILKWDHERVRDEVVSKGISLEGFIEDVGYVEVDNGQTRRIAGVSLPFGACGRDLLERAKRNLETFAAVGLTERLEESVAVMKTRLGWPYVPTLFRKNTNPARPDRQELSPAALAAIVQRNQLDLELYAFAEEMLQRHVASRPDAIGAA